MMTQWKILGGLAVFLLFSGCAAFQVGTEFQAGRRALIANNPEQALVRFQQAADINPEYVFDGRAYRAGIWTYVGRAQYETGKLPEARESLQRAVAMNEDDYLGRLYLGLTLLRTGEDSRGVKEIESGLKGLHNWLEHINYYTLYGRFWDPVRRIRSEIETTLAMTAGLETAVDQEELVASAEWIGGQMEAELDRARRDERRDRRERERDFPRHGLGLGFGLGF